MKSMYLVSVGFMLNGSEVDGEVLSQVELAPKFVFDDLKSARDIFDWVEEKCDLVKEKFTKKKPEEICVEYERF